jgi:hypothetical protein
MRKVAAYAEIIAPLIGGNGDLVAARNGHLRPSDARAAIALEDSDEGIHMEAAC